MYAFPPDIVSASPEHPLTLGITSSAMSRSRGVSKASSAVFIRQLESINVLTELEKALVSRLSAFRESIQAGQFCSRAGQPVVARIIVSGWACRQRTLSDGRRQIFGFLIPGDTIGLQIETTSLERMATVAINRVESMDALMLREILSLEDARNLRLRSALDGSRRLEEVYLLNHIMRLGSLSAVGRLAHLILELAERTRSAGLHFNGSFPMPLTQEVLSDALGLSVVHLNRTLTQLKRDALITFKSGRATVLDQGRMTSIANYESHDE